MTRIDSEDIRRLLKLYFIMGSVNCRLSPEDTLTAAADGGITLFQFREKGPSALKGAALLHLDNSSGRYAGLITFRSS